MSTTRARARKATALIRELERLNASERLDDLELFRLTRDAKALMASDAAGAHDVLGSAAGINGDAAKVHEHYRTALRLTGQDIRVVNNYAIALGRAGKFEEALPLIMEAHKRAPDDVEVLTNAAAIAVQGGRFTESLALYEAWNKLQPARRLRHEAAVRQAAAAAQRGVFTEAAVGNVTRLAHEVRCHAQIRSAEFSIDAVAGEPDKFSFTLLVQCTPEEAIEVENEFVERVVADASLMTDPGLMFTVSFRGTTINGSDGRATPRMGGQRQPLAGGQGLLTGTGGVHAEVINALTRGHDRKLKSIGYKLEACRKTRVKADYRIDAEFGEAESAEMKQRCEEIWKQVAKIAEGDEGHRSET